MLKYAFQGLRANASLARNFNVSVGIVCTGKYYITLTPCSVLWTLPHASLVKQESLTMAYSDLAWRLTLARCGRLSNVQAWCHHAQMSAWQGSAVPCWLLHTGHRCCWQAASQVGHTANDGGATTSAIHCWPPSISCARPHGLELLAGRSPRTAGLWVL